MSKQSTGASLCKHRLLFTVTWHIKQKWPSFATHPTEQRLGVCVMFSNDSALARVLEVWFRFRPRQFQSSQNLPRVQRAAHFKKLSLCLSVLCLSLAFAGWLVVLSFCFCLGLCLSVAVPVAGSGSLSVSVCVSLSLSPLCLSVSLSVFLCVSRVFLRLSVSLCVSLCLCVSLSLRSLCVSLCLSASLCVSLCLFVFLRVFLSLSRCVSQCLSVYLCLSVSLCLSASLCVSVCVSLCAAQLWAIFVRHVQAAVVGNVPSTGSRTFEASFLISRADGQCSLFDHRGRRLCLCDLGPSGSDCIQLEAFVPWSTVALLNGCNRASTAAGAQEELAGLDSGVHKKW